MKRFDVARELATHVHDPLWRQELCNQLSHKSVDPSEEGLNGLCVGLGALTHRDVLDLSPYMRTLADELPTWVREELIQATTRPLSPAGVAGLRLGLA